MKKYILLFNFILVICLSLTAQEATSVSMPSGKEIYIPKDLQGMDLQNPDSKWSYHRMTIIRYLSHFEPGLENFKVSRKK